MEIIPRSEYPRPQMVRDAWMNLNGRWDFEYDFSKSGLEKRFYEKGDFSKNIMVPFCPESRLSGIGFTDFIPAVWYRRTFEITKDQQSRTVLLHFGAVDYHCTVYINGARVGSHSGGYSSFSFDITVYLAEGINTIVVYAEDDTRSGRQPSGKQSDRHHSYACSYTRSTGIWQTVWLEFVPKTYISKYTVVPDLNSGAASLNVYLNGDSNGFSVNASAIFDGREVGTASSVVNGRGAAMRIELAEKHVWDVATPNLYDLRISLSKDGMEEDIIEGYFGLRSVYIKDKAIYFNNRPLFQRLVLDQGFYPDGIYTAPSDEALIRDIKLSMDLGFIGARLHEKAFEERFLYHADRLGYLVWAEHANWGLDITEARGLEIFLPEWMELMERDFNHPSIIGWCPFNETWDWNGHQQDDEVLRTVYLVTKALDSTRPVIDTSGNFHVITDIYDVHDYEQSPEVFAQRYGSLGKGEAYEPHPKRQSYSGQPYFVSEYGGARRSVEEEDSWGYGEAPKSEDEFRERYVSLTGTLLRSEGVCAFCYTQLYDVEQEKNGLYTYDRQPKFSQNVYDAIRDVNALKAAIE